MADAAIYLGDAGTALTVSVGATDISSATIHRIYWEAPGGTTSYVAADSISEANETITWNVDVGFFDEAGIWYGQAYLYYGVGRFWYGDKFSIQVKEVIA